MSIIQRRPSIRERRRRNRRWWRPESEIGFSLDPTLAQRYVMRKIWEQCSPLASQLLTIVGPELQCLRFRGFNPRGINTQEKRARGWLNTDSNPGRAWDLTHTLLEQNETLFQYLWIRALRCTGERLDHITVAPVDGRMYRPQVHLYLCWRRLDRHAGGDSGDITVFFDEKQGT